MIINCPYCKQNIYEFNCTENLTQNNKLIKTKDFKGINDISSPKSGENINCPKCNKNIKKTIINIYRKHFNIKTL